MISPNLGLMQYFLGVPAIRLAMTVLWQNLEKYAGETMPKYCISQSTLQYWQPKLLDF